MCFDDRPRPSSFGNQLRETDAGVTSSRHAGPKNRLSITFRQSLQKNLADLASGQIGDASSTTPPPIVMTGENWRMMKRSPGKQQRGLGQTQLGHRGLSRRNLFLTIEHDRGDSFRSVGMQMHAGAVFQRLGRRQQLPATRPDERWSEMSRRRQRHAARQLLRGHSGQVQRRALPGDGLLGRLSVHLDSAHPHASGLRERLPVHLLCESCRKPACLSPRRRNLSW